MFIAVEAGPTASGMDWDAVRQHIASTGGYLSLALIDGARSNWIVRPVPTASQIPQRVSLAGAGTASAGIAEALIDQLMQAQALVPDIETAEIRLYGGALAETELNDALKGETGINVRVFDTSQLRAARSTYKPPAPKPAPKPTAAPKMSSTPQTYSTLKPNPNSAAGRRAAQTSSASTAPQTAGATAGQTTSASAKPATAAQPGFAKRYHPFRRALAGILAATVVGIGVFPGFVWANIWGYMYPRDASLIVDAIAGAQERAFGVALLFGIAVAILGTRFRRLAVVGFVFGALSGVFPWVIPQVLVWDAPGLIAPVLSNTAAFWGMSTAYAPVLYIGAGIALSVAVGKALPATPPEVLAARSRRRAAVKDWLGRRSPIDRLAVSILLWTGLTVIVPWLIGRFILQDNIILTRGSGVFDTATREFWPTVIPLYLGGLAALLLIAGAAMVFQPWTGRNGPGIAGVVLVGAGIIVSMFAANLWASAEAQAAERLTMTAYPFDDRYLTCGYADALLTDEYGETWMYQVWSARVEGATPTPGECNRIELYRGWQWVATEDLPEGQTIVSSPVFIGGTTSADGVFHYVQTDGQTIPVRFAER